jgi:hypothetical protein
MKRPKTIHSVHACCTDIPARKYFGQSFAASTSSHADCLRVSHQTRAHHFDIHSDYDSGKFAQAFPQL